MVTETAARERRDPSTHTPVEGGIEIPSTANDIHETSDSVGATALPSGGAALHTSTNTPVVALPSGGEAPAAHEVKAKTDKVDLEKSKNGGRVETGGSDEAEGRMRVKEEMATAQEGMDWYERRKEK